MYSKIIKIFIKCKFFDLATQWELLEFYRQLFLINSPDITQLFLETLPDVLMYLNKDATICGSGLKQKLSRTALTPIYLLVYSIALKPLDLCKKINEIQKKMFKDKSTTALFVKLLLNCFKEFRKNIIYADTIIEQSLTSRQNIITNACLRMSDELVLSNLRITRSEVDATAIKNFNFSVAARVLFWLNTHYQSMYNGVNPDFIKSAFQAILKNNYSDFRFGLMDESIDLKVRSLWCEDTCESSNSLVVKETSNPWDMLLATSIINGCCNIWSGSEVWRTLQAFCCPESKVIFVTDPNGNWLARAYLDARFSKKVIRVKLYKDTFSAFRVDCYQKKIGATPIKLMLRAIAKKASNLGNWKVDILAMNKWIGKYLTTFTPSLKELESKLNNVIRFSTEDDYNNYTDSE